MTEEEIPEDFPYRKTFLHGRPRHEMTDDLRIRYPSMPLEKRAKIFTPFDALAGFRDLLREEEEKLYLESRRELTEDEMEELDRELIFLAKHGAEKDIEITVRWFVPRRGDLGYYETESGIFRSLSGNCLHMGGHRIDLGDIAALDSDAFRWDWRA